MLTLTNFKSTLRTFCLLITVSPIKSSFFSCTNSSGKPGFWYCSLLSESVDTGDLFWLIFYSKTNLLRIRLRIVFSLFYLILGHHFDLINNSAKNNVIKMRILNLSRNIYLYRKFFCTSKKHVLENVTFFGGIGEINILCF